MTVVARKVASTPVRTSAETWAIIVGILAPDPKSPARSELQRVAGVAASVISSETPTDQPIILCGHGPRVRIYCVFGDDAITGDGVNEDPLPVCPTDGDWSMSLPSSPEDLAWIQRELKRLSTKVTARGPDEPVPSTESSDAGAAETGRVDEEAFLKP